MTIAHKTQNTHALIVFSHEAQRSNSTAPHNRHLSQSLYLAGVLDKAFAKP